MEDYFQLAIVYNWENGKKKKSCMTVVLKTAFSHGFYYYW